MKIKLNGLLAGLSIAGTIGTGVLSAIATPKAVKAIDAERRNKYTGQPVELTFWDKVRICWKFYIPPAGVCLGTIVAIASNGVLNAKSQKALVGNYVLIEQAYRNYRRYIKEHYGPDADKVAMTDVINNTVETDAETVVYPDLGLEEDGDETRLFYDVYSARYFRSTRMKVLEAECHLNRNFVIRGYADLNEFYRFVGLPETDIGEKVGWSLDAGGCFYGYSWIDFNHMLTTTDDGLQCYILDMVFPPTEDYLDPDCIYDLTSAD